MAHVNRHVVTVFALAGGLVFTEVASAAELRVWVRAFIPKEHPTNAGYVIPRPGHPGEFMIPDPLQADTCFSTDHRGFISEEGASARMTSTIAIVLENGNLSVDSKQQTGPTHMLWCKDGNEKGVPKTAETNRMFWGAPAQADGQIQFSLEARANNPHIAGSPDIYYAATFLYSVDSKKLNVKATIGDFPAFEAYAQLDGGPVVNVFTRQPADAADVWNLITGGLGVFNTRTLTGETSF